MGARRILGPRGHGPSNRRPRPPLGSALSPPGCQRSAELCGARPGSPLAQPQDSLGLMGWTRRWEVGSGHLRAARGHEHKWPLDLVAPLKGCPLPGRLHGQQPVTRRRFPVRPAALGDKTRARPSVSAPRDSETPPALWSCKPGCRPVTRAEAWVPSLSWWHWLGPRLR